MKFANIIVTMVAVSMVHGLPIPGAHHVQRREPPELLVRGTGVHQILRRSVDHLEHENLITRGD
jgi:hypothetical protein